MSREKEVCSPVVDAFNQRKVLTSIEIKNIVNKAKPINTNNTALVSTTILGLAFVPLGHINLFVGCVIAVLVFCLLVNWNVIERFRLHSLPPRELDSKRYYRLSSQSEYKELSDYARLIVTNRPLLRIERDLIILEMLKIDDDIKNKEFEALGPSYTSKYKGSKIFPE